MKRGGLILLLVLMIVLGGGFLALIWIDMRHSVNTPVKLPPPTRSSQEPHRSQERPRESREPKGETNCDASGVSCASTYFADWKWPEDGSCHATVRNGYPEPDARCTPGGVTPGMTAETLRDPAWRTKCIRNCQSSEQQKHVAYEWYGVSRPADNQGANQVCELDHLVPLELGGADGLGNIWPECGPDSVTLRERYFKQKDVVENYLAAKVKKGEMPLGEAQKGIATDWVQYLDIARRECSGNRC
ncbi:hypothetical protein [Granulicella pectinivorans]|jgi:hypothetical protein|nr:hypothetical protein [Granulicella pectinivorans]